MMPLLGLLIFCLVIFAGGAIYWLASIWFIVLPLAAFCAVISAALWFNAGKRS
jgi:hypothetical protein